MEEQEIKQLALDFLEILEQLRCPINNSNLNLDLWSNAEVFKIEEILNRHKWYEPSDLIDSFKDYDKHSSRLEDAECQIEEAKDNLQELVDDIQSIIDKY